MTAKDILGRKVMKFETQLYMKIIAMDVKFLTKMILHILEL